MTRYWATEFTPGSPKPGLADLCKPHHQSFACVAASDFDALVAAYVKESPRPDCDPAMRFRAVCPDGMCRWFPTREAAASAILKAAGLGGDS